MCVVFGGNPPRILGYSDTRARLTSRSVGGCRKRGGGVLSGLTEFQIEVGVHRAPITEPWEPSTKG